jgi:glycosyltransferase involved in cell wall biosynthesis
MENNIKYSILIPAYNAEKYISRSLNSVLNQITQYNYEIVICDDGSTDNTVNIINEIKNDKVKLIKNDVNQKGIITRKKLIQEAQGDYIIWLDADDESEFNTLSIIDEYVKDNKYDIIDFSFDIISFDNTRQNCIKSDKRIKRDQLLDLFFNTPCRWYLWSKVIKRDTMLKSLPPDYQYTLDDVFFTMTLYYNSKEYISIYTQPLYHYYFGIGCWSSNSIIKNNSISYEKFIEYCEARKTEFKYNYSFLKEKGLEKKYVYKLLESCDLFSLFNELIKIE